MIVRKLASASSCRPAIDYSERKCAAGKADVFGLRNLPGDTLYDIYSTFERYENNPAVSRNTRRKLLHLAVNPGADDSVGEDGMRAFIGELLRHLGYGDQPYVVYRHFDIEREHYHIVAPRVREDGRVISDSFDHLSMMRFCREAGERYGFAVGFSDEEKERRKIAGRGRALKPRPVKAADGNKAELVRADFEEALTYDFVAIHQLKAILLMMNIRMREAVYRGKRTLMFSTPQFDSARDGWMSPVSDGYERLEKAIAANVERVGAGRDRGTRAQRARVLTVTRWCLSQSADWASFAKRMGEFGYRAVPLPSGRRMPARIDELLNVAVVDPSSKIVFSVSEFGKSLSKAMFSHMEFNYGNSVKRQLVGNVERAGVEGEAARLTRGGLKI